LCVVGIAVGAASGPPYIGMRFFKVSWLVLF
jgi:hypothetical protein